MAPVFFPFVTVVWQVQVKWKIKKIRPQRGGNAYLTSQLPVAASHHGTCITERHIHFEYSTGTYIRTYTCLLSRWKKNCTTEGTGRYRYDMLDLYRPQLSVCRSAQASEILSWGNRDKNNTIVTDMTNWPHIWGYFWLALRLVNCGNVSAGVSRLRFLKLRNSNTLRDPNQKVGGGQPPPGPPGSRTTELSLAVTW